MEEYKFLKAIFEMNRETKRIEKEMEKESDPEILLQMRGYKKEIYKQKDKGLFMVLYLFEAVIEPHVYKRGSYWLLSIAGFEYHMQYIQIPRILNTKKKVIKSRSYNSVGELGIGKAIQLISKLEEKNKEDQEFVDFMKKIEFFREKEVRPIRHD